MSRKDTMNVKEYLSDLVDISAAMYKVFTGSCDDLAGPFYDFVETQYSNLRAKKPIQSAKSYEAVWGEHGNSNAGELKVFHPFQFRVPASAFSSGIEWDGKEMRKVRLIMTDPKSFIDDTDSALTRIEGFVGKATQDIEVARRKVEIIKKYIDRLESVTDESTQEYAFLDLCQRYVNIYNTLLPWVVKIAGPSDDIRQLISNTNKLIERVY